MTTGAAWVSSVSAALDRMGGDEALVGDLAVDVPVLYGRATCDDLDRIFGRDPEIGCAAVHHPELTGVVGLVERGAFEALMSGPFGYGRALHARRPLAEVAQWDALILPGDTSVTQASGHAIGRRPERVHDHVLVQRERVPAAVPMPALLAALARTLAAQALRDPLTSLANRDAFFHRVEESCRRTATREGHGTAVVYLDLDGFKAVNDTLGHVAGDALLQAVAGALSSAARPDDLVARVGGDEFAVCLDLDLDPVPTAGGHDERDAGVEIALDIADRLRASVTALRSWQDAAHRIRVSAGVALSRAGRIDAAELVRAADVAMYSGKREGGGTVTGPVVVTSRADADPLLGTSIPEAASRGELVLHYQPIVRLADGRIRSLEALVRWQHPRLGLLTPDAFLPAVERAGQMVLLDNWVLHAACREFAGWLATAGTGESRQGESVPEPLFLNVNVSTDRLLAPGLCVELLAATDAAGLEPRLVRVEVPEDLLTSQLQEATRAVIELRSAGFALTLDDVGAGQTSLRHLRDIQADGIKIDRSYVQGMFADQRDLGLLQLLLDFAAGAGLTVTAEGVETVQQRDALLGMGCQYGQGWLFGKPRPMDRMLAAPLLPSPRQAVATPQ